MLHATYEVSAKDGTPLHLKDWGEGPPVYFSHGWPLSSESLEPLMFLLASRGMRCLAHDRRGYGRSGQVWRGHDLDTYADDLATIVTELGLREVAMVGHGMGCAEVARYLSRHGHKRITRAAFIGPFPRPPGAPDAVPEGETLIELLETVSFDKTGFLARRATQLYGAVGGRAEVNSRLRDEYLRQGLQTALPAIHFGAKHCMTVTREAVASDPPVPTLFIDSSPAKASPAKSEDPLAPLRPVHRRLDYAGAGAGLHTVCAKQLSADLYDFLASH